LIDAFAMPITSQSIQPLELHRPIEASKRDYSPSLCR
jgi:hypothetical protein